LARTVRITIDGKERSVLMDAQRTTILQAGLQAGMPLPYACQAGVCCTCRALVTEGEVHMDRNFSLEESELEQGFVLTCQAHPLSLSVSLSYDER
jgi:ring-1,2-phenylacetyl-CoA epoxidase subunit PaaE